MNLFQVDKEGLQELASMIAEEIAAKFNQPQDRWIDGAEAMRILGVKSPSTLQRYRDEGRIRYSQPDKRIILYDRDSITEYIEKHAKDTF